MKLLIKSGLIQAFEVVLYCSTVGLIFWKSNEIFGKVPNYLGPVAFLLLFSVSSLICALIVFYKPYKLFFEGKKKDAADLVLYTTFWLFLFFMIFFLLSVISK